LPQEQDCQHKQWYIEDSSQERHHWLFPDLLLQKEKNRNATISKEHSPNKIYNHAIIYDQLMEKYKYNGERYKYL